MPCKSSGSTCTGRKVQDIPCRIHMQHPTKVESVHPLVPMPQASVQAEHWKAQREARAARSCSLCPSLPACHSCRTGVLQVRSCSYSLLFIGRSRQVAAAVPSRPGCFPSSVPITVSFLPSPPPSKDCMSCSPGHELIVTQRPPCRDSVPPGTWAQTSAASWTTSW